MTPIDMFLYPFTFITGLVFGSFFNVVALRIPNKMSIVTPPSRCPKCDYRLSKLDLVPLAGYLVRKGKCAACGEPIPLYYPLAELATGVLFLLSYSVFHDRTAELLLALALVSMCMIVTVSDIVYTRIPNAVLLFFLPIILALRFISGEEPWYSYVIGGVAGFLLLLAIAVAKPGAMGMGDVKLLGMLGFVIGWKYLFISLFLASLIGLVMALVLMGAGKVKWRGTVPFGPSLCAGALIAFFAGQQIMEGYAALLGYA